MSNATSLKGLAEMTTPEIAQLPSDRAKEMLMDLRENTDLYGLKKLDDQQIAKMDDESVKQRLFDARAVALRAIA